MLLAEALALRADLQERLKDLGTRIQANARVPAGSAPDEDPRRLLEEVEGVSGELTALIRRLNRTNALVTVSPGAPETVSDLIAERDRAQRMTRIFREAARAATRGSRGWLAQDREGTDATLDVPAMQQEADRWAVRYREVDVQLQRINWSTELLE